ncbi:unnamed protein product [Vicia faba]|uniref:Uncharacterized protein n=1 Tax=Vicia faba TaxID=3906 RepID=A0AAV0YRP9_VICFA|nr:unnamed protein product [Vicia faba]
MLPQLQSPTAARSIYGSFQYVSSMTSGVASIHGRRLFGAALYRRFSFGRRCVSSVALDCDSSTWIPFVRCHPTAKCKGKARRRSVTPNLAHFTLPMSQTQQQHLCLFGDLGPGSPMIKQNDDMIYIGGHDGDEKFGTFQELNVCIMLDEAVAKQSIVYTELHRGR